MDYINQALEFLPGGFWSIQLDIVGFLAILGEASVLANGQVAALSKTCLLPRLIPAPQALIRVARSERLLPATGVVVGAHSGTIRRSVNHVPDILHQVAFHKWKPAITDSHAYQVRVFHIRWAEGLEPAERDIKLATEKAADRSRASNPHATGSHAKTRSWGPLILLAYLGCAESVALLVVSSAQRDGMSLLAVLMLSLCSSLVGLTSHWELKLPRLPVLRDGIPPSDVVIYHPNGSFLVVRCPEEISRLYFQSEECQYLIESQWLYRSICLVASLLLMIGVICLANATPLLQVLWAAAYIILNAAYWAVAALPPRWHWDMTSFETVWEDYTWHRFESSSSSSGGGSGGGGSGVDNDDDDDHHHKTGRTADVSTLLSSSDLPPPGPNPSFTQALWRAIALTRSSGWARFSEIAPNTPSWDAWLREASDAARAGGGGGGTEVRAPDATPATTAVVARMQALQRRAAQTVDVESQIDARTGRLAVRRPHRALPEWNYSEALARALKKHGGEAR